MVQVPPSENYVRFDQVLPGHDMKVETLHPCKALVGDLDVWEVPVPARLRWAIYRTPSEPEGKPYLENEEEPSLITCTLQQMATRPLLNPSLWERLGGTDG